MNLNDITAHLQEIQAAAEELDAQWMLTQPFDPGSAAEKFTCNEAETLDHLLRCLGLEELADKMLDGHAWSDSDEGDQHHDRYLVLVAEAEEAEEPKPERTMAETFRDKTPGEDWTVAISGSERHDGEAPYYYALKADGKVSAVAKALAYHREENDDDDVIPVRYGTLSNVYMGFPADFWGALNDLRQDTLPEPTEEDYGKAVAFLQA